MNMKLFNLPLPIALISQKKLVEFKNSDDWKSTGYASDIQRFVQDELFYRSYANVHGKQTAEKEYTRHTKLRWVVWFMV